MFALSFSTIITYAQSNEHGRYEINYSAQISDIQLSNQHNTLSTKSSTDSIAVIIPSISKNSFSTAQVTLIKDSNIYEFEAIGNIIEYSTVAGFSGVFDALVDFNGVEEMVTIDIHYVSPSENFTTITIGCAGDDIPQILAFGKYTNSVSNLINLEIQTIKDTPQLNNYRSDVMPLVDGEKRLQSTSTKTSSGYEVATISLYHANELRNQATMSVYAKVNSHTTDFEDYLRNVQGFDAMYSSITTYPDKYMIEIVGADSFLHSMRNVSPSQNTVQQNITFWAYIPKIGNFPEIGSIEIGIPITISSVEVAYRSVLINPCFDDNIITWNIYNNTGWNPSDFDGYHNTANGGVVHSSYTYEGNVTENIESTMGAYGQVRYAYYYYLPLNSSPIVGHMWSDKAACANSLIIVP